MSLADDQKSRSGRGYLAGRYRGENLLYGEIEYRFPILKRRQTLRAAQDRLISYLSGYQMIFRNKTNVFFDKAQQYTKGILVSYRCNIEEISDTLLEFKYFQLQYFITDSNWSSRDAIDVSA